uniref:NADH dehydrogenase subunit 2 n=1 Tax=Heteropoda venatoria TaxID=152925 RepID=UPI0027D9D2F6|nr:NADH dehydrogenase subunit 2 [Heteropoda venatoria]WCS92208.1 NADH dehydrogenase subunit 2 [Heteropoda venatoria]
MILYVSSFIMAINADDWFLIWLALEVNMMVFVVMIYERYSIKHVESCLKYFFVQSLGSGLFVGIFYVNKEWLNYFGSLILGYKIGAGPFYFWFPSVSDGLGWVSCFVLFSLQKVIPLMMLVMFMGWMIWVLIMMSLIFGVVGSFNQVHMKRLLAFSSIHHIGWLLMCNLVDSKVWIVYLLMYVLVIGSVILILSYFEIENLMGMSKSKSKWWFLLSMLSMGGMPPFLGFFLSWIAFMYFLKMDYWVVFFMVLLSVIMFYIYIRVVYIVFMGMGDEVIWGSFLEGGFFVKMDVISVLGLIIGSILGILYLL